MNESEKERDFVNVLYICTRREDPVCVCVCVCECFLCMFICSGFRMCANGSEWADLHESHIISRWFSEAAEASAELSLAL